MTLTFLKSPGQVVCGISLNLGFIWCSLMIRLWLCGTGKNSTALLSPSQCFLLGAACCQYLLLCSPCLSGIYQDQCSSVDQSCPTLCDPTNRIAARQASLSITNSQSLLKLMLIELVMPSTSHPLLSPSPPAPNPYQHQGLFQWVNSSHQVAKVLEFRLQHQSFQWTPRTDL